MLFINTGRTDMEVCFGIDIGGTTVKLGLLSMEGRLLFRTELPTRRESTPEGLLRDVKAALLSVLKEQGLSAAQVRGIGIAAPGPLGADGVLHKAANIGWGEVRLAEEAERILGFSPVFAANDANAAALGEAFFGAGRGAESMVMVTLGTGIGGGIILNGRILTGTGGTAGEIGHMTIDPYETECCGCGKKGCLEQYASATGMVRMAKRFLAEDDTPSVLRGKDPLTARDICEAAKAGDAPALRTLDFVCDRLGTALANVCNVVDPELFVIGGGVAKAGGFLLERIRESYSRQAFPHCRNRAFASAELGNDAGLMGAAAMVFGVKKK